MVHDIMLDNMTIPMKKSCRWPATIGCHSFRSFNLRQSRLGFFALKKLGTRQGSLFITHHFCNRSTGSGGRVVKRIVRGARGRTKLV